MKIIPLGDQLLVEPIEEKISIGGLVIPESQNSKEKPMRGKVLAVGPGRTDDKGKKIAIEIKEGDQILFSKYSPTEIKIDEKDLLILDEKSVLAKIK